MLKQLNIKNLILVESLSVTFNNGFNAITGETGAGKSAIISSIKLIAGYRADTKMIRKGAERAVVEALFSFPFNASIYQLLDESGIEIDQGEDLIIKREINVSGKGRAFINHQMAQISLLKKLGDQLIQIVSQHANQRLLNLEEHRAIIDTYGENQKLLFEYQSLWKKIQTDEKKIKEIIAGESFRIREIERIEREIEEIESANLQEGEEDELFLEFSLLTKSDELSKKAGQLVDFFENGNHSLLLQLNRKIDLFEGLIKIDPSLQETLNAYRSAIFEMEEISNTISKYLCKIESNPSRIEFLNERLSLLTKLRRKYGNSVQEIDEYLAFIKKDLNKLDNCENELEILKNELTDSKEVLASIALKLSNKRKEAACRFESQIIEELKELNLSKVQFKVAIQPQEPSLYGCEKVEFFFAPNFGENMIPVKESASGGEMSRIILAIETILSSKNQASTMIFDEIDSNIGGETAFVIGTKLNKIGQSHQVLCITHFSQVAKQAACHLMIEKKEENGRTYSSLHTLDPAGKEKELHRMEGKMLEFVCI